MKGNQLRVKENKYFEGWYFKHQFGKEMIAFIPGISKDLYGNKIAFIQIITNQKSYYVPYSYNDCHIDRKRCYIRIDNNIFTKKGIKIDIKKEGLWIKGIIKYGDFQKIKYDIMGPFALLPFMECNHEVLSMKHYLKGNMNINNKDISKMWGIGYVEKDWGCSFPNSYIWTQCNIFSQVPLNIMASVAEIPLLGRRFLGSICVIQYKKKEYRIATYLGAKVIKMKNGFLLTQGRYKFYVSLLKSNPQHLYAPNKGAMERGIREHPVCKVRYILTSKEIVIFDEISSYASFELVKKNK